MQRRNFLKSLLTIGVTLSPVSALIQNLSVTGVNPKSVISPDTAFDQIPFTIIVHNLSQRIVSNIDIFGSCEYLNNAIFRENGNVVIDDIEISSLVPENYKELLFEIMRSPVSIDKMVLEMSDQQILEPFTIKTSDGNGNRVAFGINPWKYKTPYDEQPDSVCVENAFCLDGLTKITLNKLNPGIKTAIRLYPATKIAV